MNDQESIATGQLSQDQLNWMNERILQVNDLILAGSRQAGFLAAAIIAASPLWMPSTGPRTLARLAIVALAISIACSAVAHVLTGWPILVFLTRAYEGHYKQRKSPYLIPAWVAGAAQAASVLFALVVFVVNLW